MKVSSESRDGSTDLSSRSGSYNEKTLFLIDLVEYLSAGRRSGENDQGMRGRKEV